MGDDASMASGHMMMDGDDDNTRSSSSTSNPDMKNNCFNQIQSRRFHRSSNHVPIFGSFCPSMDLIAIGMRSGSGGGGGASTTGGSNTNTTLDGLLAANDTIAPVGGGGSAVCSSSTNNNNHDDEFAESIVVHRILSWQSLLHLKLTQLTSSPTNDSFDTLDANNSSSSSSNNNNEEDDNDNGILCSEDIERACINAINTTAKLGVNSNSNEDNTMNKHPPSSSMQLKSSLSIGISSCRVEEDYEMKTKEKKKNYGATCIIWSPDGRYIAIGLVDGGVLIHSIEPDAVRADCIGGGSSSGGGNNGVGGGGTRGLGGDNDDDDDEGNPSAAGLHFIRPPSTRHRSLLTQLCKMKPRLQHQSLPRQVEHDEQPAEAAASINRRVTRSMAEKREGSAVGEKTKLSVASSSTTSSSKEISSLAQQSPTTFPSVAVGVAPVIGMAWNQLLPLKRRRWRRRHLGQRTASASQVYDEENNISMEDVKYAEDEMDIRETWRYASQLIDKGIGHFLPSNCQPSSTAKTITFQHQQQQRSGLRRGWGDGGDGLVAHLNVLCVATTEDIHWYLQGQYRLLSIPHGFSLLSSQERNDNECSSSSGGGVDGISMICSPDLSTLLAVVTSQQQSASCTSSSTNKNVAKLFRTSLLPRQRFELQFLSATYRSLFSHLWDARRSIRAVLVSWKTALRPLDLKFSGLVKLLSDYGVERPIARDDSGVDNSGGGGGSDSIRLEFLRFILSGRSSVSGGNDSSSSSSTSAALDQFFTRPQMHDMLLQKEFRGVEVSLSSTEVILRSRALHSIRAIVYEAEELYGMACAWDNQEIHSSSGDLIDVNTALNLYNASRVLYLSFNQCLGYIVEARTRLNDLLAWVRGTAARVRAWGTAPDSIQRKNAKALRVSNGVIQRVAAFLSSPMMFASKDGTAKVEHRTLTECIIGVPLSDFLVQRKLHQTSMPSDRAGKRVVPGQRSNNIRNLGSLVQLTFQISTQLFDQPRRVFTESISGLDISFEVQHSLVAIHTRRSAGCSDSDDTSGFFLPKTNDNDPFIEKWPFWLLLARVIGSKIELIAIPGYTGFKLPEFFLRTELILPGGCEVTSIAFYGDDGHSSLSPNLTKNAEVKEGRQAVGFVVECTSSSAHEVREELWVTPYDDLIFKKYDFNMNSKNGAFIRGTYPNEACAVPMSVDDVVRDDNAVFPKRRTVSKHQNPMRRRRAQLSLCGSRGTGGVVTFGTSIAFNILDLEEDEDCSVGVDDEE